MFTFDTAISSAVKSADRPVGARSEAASGPLAPDQLALTHRYWQAANYLTVGQIYLQENPLLREPLRPEHIKPRLLGHWGTSPGLSLLYVHLNRLIASTTRTSFISRARGTAARRCRRTCTSKARTPRSIREVTRDADGLRRLFRQFLDAGRHSESRQRPDAGLDSRRRRARLRARACVRRGVRQSRPDRRRGRRRRRSGNRSARGLVEERQLPEPRARRRGAADPASQRLQDCRARRCSGAIVGRGRARAARGDGYESAFRRGRRSRCRSPSIRCCARSLLTRAIRSHSSGGASVRASRATRAGRRSCCARRKGGPARGG